MKRAVNQQIRTIIVSVCLIFSNQLFAWGLDNQSIEEPFLRANLSQVDEMNREVQQGVSHLLIMNRNKQSGRPTSFQFQQFVAPEPCEEGEVCTMTTAKFKTNSFRIVGVQRDRCNNIIYTAIEMPAMMANPAYIPQVSNHISLTDQKSNLCGDYAPFRWKVRVTEYPRFFQKKKTTNHIYFTGNPEAIWNYEQCLESVGNTVCATIFAPSFCTASSMDGGNSPIPTIKANGSNSCHASLLIKAEGCKRGLEPDRFQNEDIVCHELTQEQSPEQME